MIEGMELSNVIECISERVDDTVKPNIQEGKIKEVSRNISDLVFFLNLYRTEISGYHHGIGFIASAMCLEEDIIGNSSGFQNSMGRFEMELTQLRLATKTDDIYN